MYNLAFQAITPTTAKRAINPHEINMIAIPVTGGVSVVKGSLENVGAKRVGIDVAIALVVVVALANAVVVLVLVR
jgi:hypothetical protein